MSYPNTTNKEIFTGNGSNQTFAYTQNTPANANVKVSILSTEGVETPLTEVTHYDLAGVGGSGGITVTYPRTSVAPVAPFDVPLSATEKIVVYLDPPSDQQLDITNNDTIPPSFKVSIGMPDPDDTQDSSLTGSRTLLASDTQTNVTKLQVYSEDWPATYDIVELEFAGIVGASAAAMEIQPLDTAVATTTNLEVNIATHIGVAIAGADNTDWATSATYTIGTSADDWLTGNARFHHFNNGYLNGVGQYNYRNASTHYGATCYYARHTTAMGRVDGFDILMSTGNISGTVRLFGIRKT
jgi:hypothetical protein